MKPEYRIREVTRYVITKHVGSATNALAEVASEKHAKTILSALIEQSDRQDPLAELSLETTDIDMRWVRALRANGINTIGELRRMSFKELLDVPNIGVAGRLNIRLAFKPYGGLRDD